MARQLMSRKDRQQLPILRRRALRKQRGLCFWCNLPISSSYDDTHPLKATADHVIPLHEGGKTIPGNVVAACRKCNNSRHSHTNRSKGKVDEIVLSCGNVEPSSPFELLMHKIREGKC